MAALRVTPCTLPRCNTAHGHAAPHPRAPSHHIITHTSTLTDPGAGLRGLPHFTNSSEQLWAARTRASASTGPEGRRRGRRDPANHNRSGRPDCGARPPHNHHCHPPKEFWNVCWTVCITTVFSVMPGRLLKRLPEWHLPGRSVQLRSPWAARGWQGREGSVGCKFWCTCVGRPPLNQPAQPTIL